MKMFKVIGNVTLARSHPSYQHATLIVAESLDPGAKRHSPSEGEEMVVAWDELGAGIGSDVAISDGGEAANPFRPELKPVDAYCAAILDKIKIQT